MCEAESEGDAEEVVAVAVDEEGGQVDVKSRECPTDAQLSRPHMLPAMHSPGKEATKLSIQLPQKVHLSVRTVLGNIRVFDKIEGDIVLASERGNITANKLRQATPHSVHRILNGNEYVPQRGGGRCCGKHRSN